MSSLGRVKLLHTAIWVFFVACIAAIPVFTALSRFGWAAGFVAVVGVEVAILLLNGMTCPLTSVAARYTSDRRANFDIYLPEWLARNNKSIFGTLYLMVSFLLLVRWLAGS